MTSLQLQIERKARVLKNLRDAVSMSSVLGSLGPRVPELEECQPGSHPVCLALHSHEDSLGMAQHCAEAVWHTVVRRLGHSGCWKDDSMHCIHVESVGESGWQYPM